MLIISLIVSLIVSLSLIIAVARIAFFIFFTAYSAIGQANLIELLLLRILCLSAVVS